VDNIYTSIALENDINTITQIGNRTYKIKTFDYDGFKYNYKECEKLLATLNKELIGVQEKISLNDKLIFKYFLNKSAITNNEIEFKEIYDNFNFIDSIYNEKYSIISKAYDALAFINCTTPFDIIRIKFEKFEAIEAEFKKQIKSCLDSSLYAHNISNEDKQKLIDYLKDDLNYFTEPNYIDDSLKMLYGSLHVYQTLLGTTYFKAKKTLLDLFEKLETESI